MKSTKLGPVTCKAKELEQIDDFRTLCTEGVYCGHYACFLCPFTSRIAEIKISMSFEIINPSDTGGGGATAKGFCSMTLDTHKLFQQNFG